MNTTRKITGNSHTDILDIRINEEGKYEVYFKFLPCPVIMNEGYLETIISDVDHRMSLPKIVN